MHLAKPKFNIPISNNFKQTIEFNKLLQEELKKNKEELSNCCITFYGSHLWKNEDEDGMYGERFVVCQRCGVEY